VLCNAPLVQNKAYWEVKIQSLGLFGVGLATRQSGLDVVPLGADGKSWVLRSDGTAWHKAEQMAAAPADFAIEEGDTIGMSYDHESLNFYLNGQQLELSITGVRGQHSKLSSHLTPC
jgi:hypothetical protein